MKHFDDLEEIDCPINDLDDNTIGRLVRAHLDGAVIECRWSGGWSECPEPAWQPKNPYRLKPKPQPKPLTKPSINWDHVAPIWKYLARNEVGDGLLFTHEPVPTISSSGWRLFDDRCGRISVIQSHASFIPGTCDWRDSLVMRGA
ncbi:MAG: hypothetical protein ACRC52_07480 [Aeromonas veronii]